MKREIGRCGYGWASRAADRDIGIGRELCLFAEIKQGNRRLPIKPDYC
jgi:hypothetical protein